LVTGLFRSLFLAIMACLSAVPATFAADANTPAGEADLRPALGKWGLSPRRQGQRPTCSVFAFTGVLEFAVAKARNRGEPLSVEYVNWAANQTRSPAHDGGFFSDMWSGFARYGACAETSMPYLPAYQPDAAPAAAAQTEAEEIHHLTLHDHWVKRWDVNRGLNDDEFQALKSVLQQGWPVSGGFRWPKKPAWKDDTLQMRQPDQVFDGHSVLLVGFHDDESQPGGGVFLIRDSGTGKDLSMPYVYARAYMNDALWIDAAPPAAVPAP
jgi:hypothetical protein